MTPDQFAILINQLNALVGITAGLFMLSFVRMLIGR